MGTHLCMRYKCNVFYYLCCCFGVWLTESVSHCTLLKMHEVCEPLKVHLKIVTAFMLILILAVNFSFQNETLYNTLYQHCIWMCEAKIIFLCHFNCLQYYLNGIEGKSAFFIGGQAPMGPRQQDYSFHLAWFSWWLWKYMDLKAAVH